MRVTATEDSELDRFEVMMAMFAQGIPFRYMVEPLKNLGLLNCQTDHRWRVIGVDDETKEQRQVCATCENTILVYWKRQLANIGAHKADIDETRGEWLTVHNTVQDICFSRFVQKVEIVTERSEEIDGKTVMHKTTRHETVINPALLKLACEVQDKVARMRGLNVKNPASARTMQRRLLNVRRRELDGERQPKPN